MITYAEQAFLPNESQARQVTKFLGLNSPNESQAHSTNKPLEPNSPSEYGSPNDQHYQIFNSLNFA